MTSTSERFPGSTPNTWSQEEDYSRLTSCTGGVDGCCGHTIDWKRHPAHDSPPPSKP